MKKRFSKHKSPDEKRIFIEGPFELEIEIDYDDVQHRAVDRDVKQLLEILEEYWK